MIKPNSKINFTKKQLDSLPIPPDGKRYAFKDEKEKGLIIRITAKGKKTFQLYQKFQGTPVRITLGEFPDMSVEQARTKARIRKGELADNKNYNIEKKKLSQETSLKEFFKDYMERYSKIHKKSWEYDEREIPKFLGHWFNRKLSSIHKHEIQDMHIRLYKKHGLYQANRMLERLRAMYNKAIEWGWDGANPTNGIKKYKEKSRDRFVLPNEMPFLFEALEIESNETSKDYILMLLMTGARKSNVLAMRWEEINWERKVWRIPETKNGEPLTVPLTPAPMELLKNRRFKTNSDWVFPAESETGHLSDPAKTWDRIRKRATLEIWRQNPEYAEIMDAVEKRIANADNYGYTVVKLFKSVKEELESLKFNPPVGLMDVRIHDIRRTVGSFQAMTGASLPIIGKSLGHKNLQSTQIYARLHDDPVRESMEKASDAMFAFREE
ncbi:MAG: site-specific integrase [Proteobacteria bacterium]|nr:site-specific integrase [Pseudomonadota bacterium]